MCLGPEPPLGHRSATPSSPDPANSPDCPTALHSQYSAIGYWAQPEASAGRDPPPTMRSSTGRTRRKSRTGDVSPPPEYTPPPSRAGGPILRLRLNRPTLLARPRRTSSGSAWRISLGDAASAWSVEAQAGIRQQPNSRSLIRCEGLMPTETTPNVLASS